MNSNFKSTSTEFNNTIKGKAYVDIDTTSVLSAAEHYSPYGISFINIIEGFTDIPDGTYIYGAGVILRRSNNQVTILLFSNAGNKIAVNNYYLTRWSGWKTLLS